MQMLIEHMKDDFDIVIFPEEDILNKPIEEWPIVDVLMAFYSTGMLGNRWNADSIFL